MGKRVPKLRFPEFSGEWEEKKLGEVCALRKEKYDPRLSNNSYRCVELEDILGEAGGITNTKDSLRQNSIKTFFKAGDVLYGKLRPYLHKYAHPDFNGVCSTEIWCLFGTEVSNRYLYHLIQTSNFDKAANKSCGTKMPRADWEIVSDNTIYVPKLIEQQKIADFLSTVDNIITSEQRILDDLQLKKKGLMQKLFSRELRFKDKDGREFPEWEAKRLGEVCSLRKEKYDPKTSKSSFRCIELEDIISETGNIINTKNSLNQSSIKTIFKAGDVLYGKLRPYLHKYAHPDFDGVCSTEIWCLYGTDITNSYLYFLIQMPDFDKVANKSCGTKMPRAEWDVVSNKIVYIPILEEQKKIAEYLGSQDSVIEEQRKIVDGWKLRKKGLLQQMFV
ncbi:MAG: restriction endonuclease subunit S [Treponema sp.]|nr:restriction endonuclease subunit S [Treponema sp.]